MAPCVAFALTACSTLYPPRDQSTLNRINDELKQAAEVKTPPPAAVPDSVSRSLLPPLKMPMPKMSGKQLEQRFDLVVNDVPATQVFVSIVSGTRYSILVQPKKSEPGPQANKAPAEAGLPERISVNLRDVTVFEALDAIRDMYGYEYRVEGNRIFVSPQGLQTRLYQINYILGQRQGVSDLQVIGGASVGSSSSSNSSTGTTSGTSGTGTTTSNYSSVQATGLSSAGKANVWGEVEDTVRTVLGCQIPKNSASVIAKPGSSSSSTSSGTASRADVTFSGETQTGERARGVDGCTDGRAMAINQLSGTVMVRAMPDELRTIESMLRAMQLNIAREVIIEAKIIDVELNSGSQQGINWAGFQRGAHRFSVGGNTAVIDGTASNGGAVSAGSSLADLLGTGLVGAGAGGAFAAGMGMAMQFRNFSAMINFLQTQGTVHVLSSPRIATLNNQKAVLKVGTEEPFVTNINGGTATPGTGGSLTVVTPPTLQYQPFFSGISLDVTPQIDDADNITLHVHPMVNSVTEVQKPSLPSAAAFKVPFAINTISETDSVVKTRDGQVVVIGGLMTETVVDDRSKVPGAGDAPAVGALFRKGNQKTVKRELVILLKPTVVHDDGTAWGSDISAAQQRIEDMNPPQPAPEMH